mgnify:CR=1 FL=1
MICSQLSNNISLRGNQKVNIKNDKDIQFQIIDWKSNDIEIDNDTSSNKSNESNNTKHEYQITLYGITNENHTICVIVNGYKPYFYIKIPENWNALNLRQYVEQLKNKMPINQKQYKDDILSPQIVKKKIFRGFTNYQYYKIAKLNFRNKKAMSLVNYMIKNNNDAIKDINKKQIYRKKITDENKKRNLLTEINKLKKKIIIIPYLLPDGMNTDIYESNLDPVLRFIHEQDISPCGWVQMKKQKYEVYEEDDDISYCHINIYTNFKNVVPYDKDDINKIVLASFDIECDSSHGDFPIANKDYTQLASFIYDKYNHFQDKIKENKTILKIERFKNINNIELFTREIIDYSFKKEDNPFEVPYIYTKQNKKPIQTDIDNIFKIHCCPQCQSSIKFPIDNYEERENKYIFQFKEEDVIYNDGKGEFNKTLRLNLIKNKKDTWNNVYVSCQNINEDTKKPCGYIFGNLKKTNTDYIEFHLPYDKIDFINQLIKTKPDKKEEITRDNIISRITNIFNTYLPNIEGDKVIQIGTVLQRYGEKKPFLKHICTLGSCDEISGCIVESVEDEKELLLCWSRFINKVDPDFITGYNIFGFDYNFIWERAKELGCVNEFCYLGKNMSEKSILVDKTLSSAGLGDNILKYIEMSGRVQMDLLKIIQRDHNLVSYKLDDVSSEFINGSVKNIIIDTENNQTILECDNVVGIKKLNYVKLSYKDNHGEEYYNKGEKLQIIDIIDKKLIISKSLVDIDHTKKYKWGLSKDDVSPKQIFELQKKGSKERAIIAKYCIQDCELCLDLCSKLDIVSNNIGMANVCKVPLSFIFLRGQGIKIFSLVAKQCALEDYVIPLLEKVKDEDKEGYEGAIVLPPKPGIYLDEPVSVLDYSSLYPSSMISENLSHETICVDKKWLGKEGAEELHKLGYTYKDITYDNYRYIKKGKALVKIINKDKPTVTCRFVQPHKDDNQKIIEESRAVIPRILRKLLKARKDTRKKIPLTDDPFKKSVLDGLQLAYKVTANSLYGSIGASTSQVAFKEIAASTTATGRKLIYLAKNFVEENYEGADTVYGDSVTGDEPLLLRKPDGTITIRTIESLSDEWEPYENFKPFDTIQSNRRNKEKSKVNYEVWANNKWNPIIKVIRHKTNKKIYRVNTHYGVVDVTEDHSLLNEKLEKIKPNECIVGETKLSHTYPTFNEKITINDINEILMNNIDIYHNNYFKDGSLFLENKNKHQITDIINRDTQIKLYYFCGIYHNYITNHGYNYDDLNLYLNIDKLKASQLYYLIKSIGFQNCQVNYNDNQYHIHTMLLKENPYLLQKIVELRNSKEEYVYDLETQDGIFHCGVGEIQVKNTDSVFINFNPKDENGNRLYGKEALAKSIELGTEAGKKISTYLEEPHDLEYEKTFWPFILLSKKRYVGNKYENDPDHYKETSMGIVLKRRDNAPIVKYIYGGCINIIMNKKDIQLSIDFLKQSLKELTQGKFKIDKLVITKSLKAYYKDPEQIAHKVLADRIGRRDPGNKPQPNDRIPYVYIRVKEDKSTLQGDKIELPSYVKEHNLPIDYNFYITNQIMKPVCQIYALIVEDLKGFKHHKGYFQELEKQYLKSCETVEEKKKKKDKIQDLKMKEVENILFGEALREGQHKKNGTQDISKWFIKKT